MPLKLAIVLGLSLCAPSLAWAGQTTPAPTSQAQLFMCVAPGLQPFCAASPATAPPAPDEADTIPLLRPFVELARGVSRALRSTLPATATTTRTSM